MKILYQIPLLVVSLNQLVTAETAVTNQPVGYVNILQGTDSNKQFSHGNTLPLVGMPWGMVAWSLQNGVGGWFFNPNGRVDGIRATHQPSPWMGDYSYFVLMPQAHDLRMDVKARTQDYDTNTAILRPDYEKIDLKQDAITVELTGTERCGVFRLTYHTGTTGRLILDRSGKSKADLKIEGRTILDRNGKSKADLKIEGRTIYGVNPSNAKNVSCYFVVKLDRDITQASPIENTKDAQGYVEFATAPTEPVIVKVGTSFISWEQAEQNLRAETEGTFEAVHERVAGVWNANLGKIEIEATEDQKKTFYTCLYRAQMFPQGIFEIDASGKTIHFSPYDGKIHDGELYAGIGIWDGFRTTFPFLTLVYPSQLDKILQGFVNASVEGNGPLPEWPSPGYGGGMPGQHCAAIFADAVVKGRKGFDAATAYEVLRKGAFEGLGRKGGNNYLKLGYLLGPQYGAVSTTLDYAYDDWCVAQMARQMNHPEDAKTLMERSQNYRKLWDPSVGFMREKKTDGTWAGKFDEFKWMGPYCESGPWQASWFVPHDPAGLTDLLGGREKFAAKLDKLFSLSIPKGHKPGIHEEKEMVAIPFGQCALNNQPSFQIPYLYAAIGQPWKTQYWTRRACAELFNAGPRGFCGDEDNGSMASWYLLSAIGLYSFCPGTPEYIVTSPLFAKVTIHLADNKTLVITASNNSDKNVYIQKRLFNGKEVTGTVVRHQDLIKGGELHCEMGPTPKTDNVSDKDLPYSASKKE
jgi:predicted alpha-1,2-mannosidase